ncbi:uncharacterized protein LOC131064178 isoform X1 [Cryptomeria japonica]|uniref:uncharacterized protein LOC131064178 isoform X1 n=3 Tax=Cryptomeria japonica TaxID=3369 RepID=UPI0027DA4D12|nr:uncharacterized protein LOC131064178 isoform X1 [Cryptomeria japonica]
MELSDQWKAAWCIGSIFSTPQLITGPSAEILGPLLFENAGEPLQLLSTGYRSDLNVKVSLNLDDEVDRIQGQNGESFVPYEVLHECVAEDMNEQQLVSVNSNLVFGNLLQGLKCRDGTLQLFFPVGANMSEIGSICYDKEMKCLKHWKELHHNGHIFPISNSYHPILQLATVGRSVLAFDDSTEGFLLARTANAVHWFRAETIEGGHTLKHMAFAKFRVGVSHACWNPHLPEESAVILENGELRLFDICSCLETPDGPVRLKGKSLPLELTKVRGSNNNFPKERLACKKYLQRNAERGVKNRKDPKGSWWCCEYGWHPRILLVASCSEVQLVDFRFKKEKCSDYSTIIAKVNFPAACYCSITQRKDQFVAFARADYDIFKFAVATRQHLLLFDSRQPLTPILQWEHGMKQHPVYLQMLRLSELRPLTRNKYKWASDAGCAILAASFRSGDMRVFCYGPKPSNELNVCKTRVHMFPDSCDTDMPEILYSWELPSKLFTVNDLCSGDNSIDLKIQGDLPSEDVLYPKFDKSSKSTWPDSMYGFYIVSDHASHTSLAIGSRESAQGTTVGFSLVQLTGAGELQSQRYQASRRLVRNKSRNSLRSETLLSENLDIQKKARYIYRRLPCFLNYLKTGSTLNGELLSNCANGLNMCKQSGVKSSDCALLPANRFGLHPPVEDFHQLASLCSIYEISCKRLWMSLPLDLLKLAFAVYSHIGSLERKLPDFLQISSLDWMPLFSLSKLKRKKKQKTAEENNGEFTSVPMLPLPFLLDLQQRKEMISESTPNTGQAKIRDQCQYLLDEFNNLKRAHMIPQVGGIATVSLEDDTDVWPGEQNFLKENYLLLHEPSENPSKDECQILSDYGFHYSSKEAGLKKLHDISVHDKYVGRLCHNVPSGDSGSRPVMSELDHDICATNLSFVLEPDLKAEEMKGLRRLKQKYQNWQKDFQLYQNYLRENLYHCP